MVHISRRKFLAGSLATISLTSLMPSQWVFGAGLLGNLFGQEGRATPAITPNGEFYVTSYDNTPFVDLESWSLRITGLVDNPLTFTYNDLLQREQTTMISTLECIGNPLGGFDIGTAKWEGVQVNALLDEAGISSKAVDVVLHAADGYSDSIPVSRAMNNEILLAHKMNGVPLPTDHGFPARAIVPGIYGMKSVKWLTALEIVDHDYKGYWQKRGWPDDAYVKTQSRIDLPGDRETITTTPYTVKGIAFGGLYGIRRVEISTDTGLTWEETAIAPQLSPYAWVHWSYIWQSPATNEYTLLVKATDGRGQTQEPKPGEVHAITVDVQV